MYQLFKNKNTGFTLAEVLITLLIIGVVASLVIPAIINDTQKEEMYTAFKKDYSVMSDAVKMMMIDNGGTLAGLFNDQNDMLNKFGNYITFQKKCNAGVQGCFYSGTNTWRTLYGDDGWYNHVSYPTAILNDGSTVSMIFDSVPCTRDYGAGTPAEFTCAHFHIDVNGFKAPNILGRDIFGIWVAKTGIYPMGLPNAGYNSMSVHCNKNSSAIESGRGCAVKILKGEKID
jgi:prepilin-type N-terminal cleavage/methylation domain-containing protein